MKKEDGFQELSGFKDAIKNFIGSIDPISDSEEVCLEEAVGRVLSEDIVSPVFIPRYKKAAMDGYAVKARDTFGASDSSPVVLDLNEDVGAEGAVRVHTGSVVPDEADAVVMIEDVEKELGTLRVFKAVSPGDNVDFVGDDIEEDEVLFHKGHELRAFDMGFLRSVGVEEVEVYREPRVLVVPTGNEVVEVDDEPGPGEVIESNSLVIKLLVEEFGGVVERHCIVGDDPEEIRGVLEENKEFDLVIFSGGTSVGGRDYTADVVGDVGEVFSHGVAIKPGKPVLLGKYGDVDVVCLPGHPAACSLTAILFLKPVLACLGHREFFEKKTNGYLSRKIESSLGFRTFTRVRVRGNKVVPVRTSGSGIQSSITSADGYLVVGEDKEGVDKGEEVEVILFE